MAGLFFSYAKSLQPARRSRLCDVRDDGDRRSAVLHPHSVDDEKVRQPAEARADGNNPGAGTSSEDPRDAEASDGDRPCDHVTILVSACGSICGASNVSSHFLRAKPVGVDLGQRTNFNTALGSAVIIEDFPDLQT
jgi:hypothetical protein